MRITTLLAVPLLAGVIALPTRGSAQATISVTFGARLGPEIGVFAYAPERYGDWQDHYQQWRPVTVYDINGRFYLNAVSGARPVQLYVYNNEYFFPPQEQEWVRRDRRYNYQRRPTDSDYGRARAYEPDYGRVDPRLGREVGVLGYSQERAGNWRRNSRRWTPVTLYEVRGRYYLNNVRGARPVAMYRFRNEYFLPPADQAFAGYDRRFNYNHQPSNEDRGRVRDRP